MNPRPKSVKALENYKIQITFENEEIKTFDCKPLLNYPVYKALKNIHVFNNPAIQYGTVIWNNNIDICPDTLYLDSKP